MLVYYISLNAHNPEKQVQAITIPYLKPPELDMFQNLEFFKC